MIRRFLNAFGKRLKCDSGVAGLLIAGLIMILAFSAITVFLGRARMPAGFKERPATQANISKVRAALQAYANANGRLPCPALPSTINTPLTAGLEDTASCTGHVAYRGVVPWRTIGLTENDVFDGFGGRLLTYGVANIATSHSCPGGLSTAIANYIRTNNDGGNTGTSTELYVAALVSHGENGFGAITKNSGAPNTSTLLGPPRIVSVLEQQNWYEEAAANAAIFTIATTDKGSTVATHFDDLVYPIEYGTSAGNFKFCGSDADSPLANGGDTAETGANLSTGTGNTRSGNLPITDASGAGAGSVAASLTGSGAISGSAAAGYGVGGVGSPVDYGETLTFKVARAFDHFSLVLTLGGGSAAADREVMVTGLLGDQRVGVRILPGDTAASHGYSNIGFGGARFDKLIFTVLNSGTGTFLLNNLALCSYVYPCTASGTTTQTSMTTAFYAAGATSTVTSTAQSTQGASTGNDEAFAITSPGSIINAGGIVAISAATTFAVSDGTAGNLTFYTTGTPRNLTNVGPDIYFISGNNGASDPIYVSRRTTSSYQPAAVNDTTTGSPLYSCLTQRMISVYDAIFFEGTLTQGSIALCALWRMRAGESAATLVPLPTANGYESSGTPSQFFEAQGRLYLTAPNATVGNELFRFPATGNVTYYDTFNLTGGATGSTFPNFTTTPPVTLPGSSGLVDALFFRANNQLYTIYKDVATDASGAFSTTAHVVDLSDGGVGLGLASGNGVGNVVGTRESAAWVYYVQSLRADGTTQDVFRFTTPEGHTTGTVTCLGFSGLSLQSTIAASGGRSFAIGEFDTAGETYVYRAISTDYGATCGGGTGGTGGTQITSGAMVVTDPSGIGFVFGGQGSARLAGNIYTRGSDGDQQILYLPSSLSTFRTIDDGHGTSTKCMTNTPNSTNLAIVSDYAFFSADSDASTNSSCGATTQRMFSHNSALTSVSGARQATANLTINADNPSTFVPMNEATIQPYWAP